MFYNKYIDNKLVCQLYFVRLFAV